MNCRKTLNTLCLLATAVVAATACSTHAAVILYDRESRLSANASLGVSGRASSRDHDFAGTSPDSPDTDFSPFSESVAASASLSFDDRPEDKSFFSGSASTSGSHSSQLTFNAQTLELFAATASAEGMGTFSVSSNVNAFSHGASTDAGFILIFDVTDATANYHLTGSLFDGTAGQDNVNIRLARVAGLGGRFPTPLSVIHELYAEDVSSGSFDFAGQLGVGSYHLRAEMLASSSGESGNATEGSGSASFSLNLTFTDVMAPETEIRWTGPADLPAGTPPSGLFSVAENWDADQVPEKSDARSDIALFDLPALYSVNVGTASSERLLVTEGNVTFTGVDYQVAALSDTEPGVVVDNARLTLDDGELRSVHALIGESAAARVDVLGEWTNTGSLRIGGGGEGILAIADAGEVTSGETRIGTGAGGGEAVISGATAEWDTGNIAVGYSGKGTLVIDDGAQVTSGDAANPAEGEAVIGRGTGLGSRVDVQGVTPTGDVATWHVDGQLKVGADGAGRLNVATGGLVAVTEDALIATRPGATGDIVVAGAGDVGQIASALFVVKDLVVGAEGVGELEVEAGGKVSALGSTTIGKNGPGIVTVAGFTAGAPVGDLVKASILNAGTTLTVGGKSHGTLTVEGGAHVTSGFAVVGDSPGVTGEVVVRGMGNGLPSLWESDDQIFVGQPQGIGAVVVEDGGRVKTGGIMFVANGVGSAGSVVVTGGNDGSGQIRSTLTADGLVVGGTGSGILFVEEGALVHARKASVGTLVPGVDGQGLVTVGGLSFGGNQSTLRVDEELEVGGDEGQGIVTLQSGRVEAARIFVNQAGRVQGIGTLAVDPAERFVNGGYIAPGLSPGTLAIEGDYEQRAGGVLEVEIAGLADGQFDVLAITGDATLGGTLLLKFLDGFAPTAGDTFNFLDVGGIVSGDFAEVQIKNLLPGFQFDPAQIQQGALVALNDGVAVPEPASLALLALGGLMLLLRRRGGAKDTLKRKSVSSVIAVIIALSLSSGSVNAALLSASADTFITEHSLLGGSGSTHGSDPDLYTISQTTFRSYPLVRFDLTPFAGETVTGPATVRLFVSGIFSQTQPRSVGIHPVLVAWNDATATYNNFGGSAGVQFGADAGAALDTTSFIYEDSDDNRYVDWTIPAATVQSWIDSPATNFGLLLNNQTTAIGHFDVRFHSLENVNPPQLEFTSIIPEPASVSLLLFVVAGLWLLRGRVRDNDSASRPMMRRSRDPFALAVLAVLAVATLSESHVRADFIVYSNNFEANTDGFDVTHTVTLPSDATGGVSTYLGRRTPGSNSAVLTLTGLTAGVVYDLAFDLYIGGTWDGNLSFGPDTFSLNTSSAGLLVNATFRNGFPIGNPTPSQTYSDATPLGDGGLVRTREGADVELGEPIYYFGRGAGNPLLSFTAAGTTESLTFRSVDAQGSSDEFFALTNVVVSTRDVPEPATAGLIGVGLLGLLARRRAKR